MVIDCIGNARRYFPLHPAFPKAFDFLNHAGTASLPDGRHEIEGDNVFALLQSYETLPVEEGRLEAHRRYIDIQFILSGSERIGWAPFASQPVAEPYDLPRDIAFFHGPAQLLRLDAGGFMLLWPEDLHMPMRHAAGTPGAVRKVVIKVKV